ncbi:MAG: type IV secretory system conjugative DNA transfer family protein [Coriobacteriia bacterium]|nr:type IV secretory system conjugative DNA transfer family protein [Coriobacteriia bacterium]
MTAIVFPLAWPAVTGYASPLPALVSGLEAVRSVGYPAALLQSYGMLASGAIPPTSFLITATFCSVVALLVVLWSALSQEEAVSKDSLLGSAKVKNSPAARLKGNDSWNGKRTPRSAGLVYGFERGRYLYESRTPHGLVVGRTGSGKSRFVLLPTMHLCLEAGYGMVVSDVKNELFELTSDRARERGRVVLLDLENPLRGDRYNPLQLIVAAVEAGDQNGARNLADRLAADLVPAEPRNPFFSNAARGLLAACFLAVASSGAPTEERNMASVCDLVERGTTGSGDDPALPLKRFFLDMEPESPAFACASEFLSAGTGNAAKNVLSTAKVALRPFTSPGIRWMTAESSPTIDEMVGQRTFVYLHVLGKENPSNVILTSFLNQWWARARAHADMNGGTLETPVMLGLDELGNFPKIDCLGEVLSLGRSYGVRFAGFVQGVDQLNVYNKPGDNGAGRNELLANVGVKVALGLSDRSDRELFSELVGRHVVKARGTSEQRGDGRQAFGSSSNERDTEVIHSWEWLSFSPEEDGAVVVKAKENYVRGHDGTFRMPLVDASKTPAGPYFGLGAREEETRKRMAALNGLLWREAHADPTVRAWRPPLDEGGPEGDGGRASSVGDDEFSAWD